jgi:hypothetical protein
MIFLGFLETILMPNSSAKVPKIAFPEEFSFPIYNKFSSQSKQNGFSLTSSTNTIFCEIFGGLEDHF